MLETIKVIFSGIVVGIANVIPGVSGGTIAVIFNIYDRIIACTHRKNLKKDWPFLVKLIIGMAVGILLFSKLIEFLFDTFPTATQLAFVGLIIGSLPMIFKRTVNYKKTTKSNIFVCIAAFLVFLALLIYMTIAGGSLDKTSGAEMAFSWPLAIILFFVMILAAFAMILPGISGSFVVLALGYYPTVIGAISGLTDFSSFNVNNIFILIPVGLGAAIGLVGGLLIIRKLLEKAPAPTFSAICGLMVGAVFAVFPYRTIAVNAELFIGIAVMLLTAATAYFFAKTEKKESK